MQLRLLIFFVEVTGLEPATTTVDNRFFCNLSFSLLHFHFSTLSPLFCAVFAPFFNIISGRIFS